MAEIHRVFFIPAVIAIYKSLDFLEVRPPFLLKQEMKSNLLHSKPWTIAYDSEQKQI